MLLGRYRWLSLVGVLALVASSSGQAHSPKHINFSGLIEDTTVPSAGAWVLTGTWSLDAKEARDGSFTTADFSAALTMERSDYFLLTTPGADPENLATRNPHTHHIAVLDAAVTPITGGFRVSGPATITGNGGTALFGTANSLQIDIVGGTLVAFSNIKLTFGGNAASHFGTLPVAGIVRRWK